MSVHRSCTTLGFRLAARRAGARLALLAAAALAGCADATGPAPAGAPLDLVYLDNLYRLTVLRVGGAPVTTGVANAVPFAAAAGMVLIADSVGVLSRLGVGAAAPAGPVQPTLVPRPATRQAGALSADGRVLTWVEATPAHVFLYWADVVTGARDSVDLLPTTEPTSLLGMLVTVPAISPDGRTTAFLLRRAFSMELLRFDRFTHRTSSVQLLVPVASRVEPLAGRPRWMPDGSLRFLARLRAPDGTLTDTLAVLAVDADEPNGGAIVHFTGSAPDSLGIERATDYSFSDDGDAVAFILGSRARDGIFLLRRGHATLEPLVYGDGVQPHYPVLVPGTR